jgi:hypothetical protein
MEDQPISNVLHVIKVTRLLTLEITFRIVHILHLVIKVGNSVNAPCVVLDMSGNMMILFNWLIRLNVSPSLIGNSHFSFNKVDNAFPVM